MPRSSEEMDAMLGSIQQADDFGSLMTTLSGLDLDAIEAGYNTVRGSAPAEAEDICHRLARIAVALKPVKAEVQALFTSIATAAAQGEADGQNEA